MEVTNRFEGLDLVDILPEELWMEVYNIVQKEVPKTIPKKKECKRAKWLSVQALQKSGKRIKSGKGERERYTTQLNAEFQRIAGRDKKVFLSEQWKEIEENDRMEKTRALFRKLEISREHFMQG